MGKPYSVRPKCPLSKCACIMTWDDWSWGGAGGEASDNCEKYDVDHRNGMLVDAPNGGRAMLISDYCEHIVR